MEKSICQSIKQTRSVEIKSFQRHIVTLVVLKFCIVRLNISATRLYRLLLMNGIIWTLLALIRPVGIVYTEFMIHLELG